MSFFRRIKPLPREEVSGLKKIPAKLRVIDKELEEVVQAMERGDVDPADLELENEFGSATPPPDGRPGR